MMTPRWMTGRSSGRRGIALAVVLGVLTLVVVYLVTAQTAVQSSLSQTASARRSIRRQAATGQFLAQASRLALGASQEMTSWGGTPAIKAKVSVEPAATETLSGGLIKTLPGDAVATIAWLTPPMATRHFLVNLKGARAQAIALGQDDASAEKLAPVAAPKAAASANVSNQPARQANPGVKQ